MSGCKHAPKANNDTNYCPDCIPVSELLKAPLDPQVREVFQALLMSKQFDAGARFAREREKRLSQEALDKATAYLKSLKEAQS